MTNKIIILVLCVAMFMFMFIFIALKKGRMPLKYALVWIVPTILIFFLAVFPQLLIKFSSFLGFAALSNLITGIIIVLLLFISMSLTIIVAGMNTKIVLLIQEVSTAKARINELEKNMNKKN